ncbi:WYL domain-containing protein [Sphingomonas sp. Leaf37]|uniref:WYL domain-containing protein n=1 Tax=Sphingomonas sp. Leaf37 TaxID=2876552 RepID=UPI001E306398|nr:WYL domain-containing protein [Sphingomonas sp. Leaf37]
MIDGELKPAQRARLHYLDQRLTWLGQANRRDLIERFGISNAQAAVDFRIYMARVRAPAPAYDAVRKTYVADRAHLGLGDVGEFPSLEAIYAQAHKDFARLLGPTRQCPAPVMRELNQAIERRCFVEIDYVSMSSGRRDRQWIAPAHIASDGERLHVRAWSPDRSEWRDFLPVRVSSGSSFAMRPVEEPLPPDEDWDTMIEVRLRPRADLTAEQKRAVRLEYGFEGDGIRFETRRSLEFYIDRRWGLDRPGARLERY